MFIPSIAIAAQDHVGADLRMVFPSLSAYKSDVSDSLDSRKTNYQTISGTMVSTRNSVPSQATQLSLSYLRDISESFGLGFEAGIEQTFSNSYGLSGINPTAGITFSESMNERMDSYLAGMRLVFKSKKGSFAPEFRVSGGWINGKLLSEWEGKINSSSPVHYNASATYSGDTFFGTLGGSLGFMLSESFRMGIAFDYRFAKFSSLASNDNVDSDRDGSYEVKRGDTYKDVNGSALPFDLSGFQTSFEIRYGW